MVNGKSVVEFFIAEVVHSVLPGQKSRHSHPDEVVDHRREEDGHEMVFTALPIEGLGEIVGLLPSAELDLHPPARPIDRTQLVGRKILTGKVRKHEVPTVADQADRVRLAPFGQGIFSALFTAFASDRSTGPYGHKTTTLTHVTRFHRQIDHVSAVVLEKPFKSLPGVDSNAKGEREARQPIGPTTFNFNEFRKGKVTMSRSTRSFSSTIETNSLPMTLSCSVAASSVWETTSPETRS